MSDDNSLTREQVLAVLAEARRFKQFTEAAADPSCELITWIPVAERLPEDLPGLGVFLVASPDGVSDAVYQGGRWIFAPTYEADSGSEDIDGVTHWAELPKGPGRR